MRYLLISFCFVLVSCGSYPKKQKFLLKETSQSTILNPYFSSTIKDYVYKANIDVYNNSFGGLLILKKINDQEHRVVFTTEMGNKIFDFSFLNDDFKVNFILDDMNKPFLLNILKKDFKVLIKGKIDVISTFNADSNSVFETRIADKSYFYFYENNVLNKITRVSNGKEKVLFLFSEINDNIAQQIKIIHNTIKLKIRLKSIK